MKHFEHGSLMFQKRAIIRIRTGFLETAPDVRFCADIVAENFLASRRGNVWPATSTSIADLIVPNFFCSTRKLRTVRVIPQLNNENHGYRGYQKHAKEPYMWENSPENLFNMCRTTSHPNAIHILHLRLSPKFAPSAIGKSPFDDPGDGPSLFLSE